MVRKKRVKKKDQVKVFLPEMLDASLLREDPHNSQRQSRHAFKELRDSIKENGFDEHLIVRPVEDGYEIVSGNHRFRAGRAEGMEQFPCVVREDWDEIKGVIEGVRRNYVRGKIDKEAFTKQVDLIANEASMPVDAIAEAMGFEDVDKFADLYRKEREKEEQAARKMVKEAETGTSAQAVKILDDLGNVFSSILAEHGHTVPNSFIIFPAGNRHHMYIACNPALKQMMQAIAEQAVHQHIDINIALAGLLQIGAANSGFLKGDGGVEVNEAGRDGGTEGDEDLEPIKDDSDG